MTHTGPYPGGSDEPPILMVELIIFIFSVSGSLKHLSIDTMIIQQLSNFYWLLSIKTMITLRRLSV